MYWLAFTQHCRRRRQWHGRSLPDNIPWWWFLDGRTCFREALVHTWKCATWPVPLSMSIQLYLLHLAQEDATQYIDFNDIFEFPDVMLSAEKDEVPSLEDILRLWRSCKMIVYKISLFTKIKHWNCLWYTPGLSVIYCMINNMFMNSGTPMCNLDIHIDKLCTLP